MALLAFVFTISLGTLSTNLFIGQSSAARSSCMRSQRLAVFPDPPTHRCTSDRRKKRRKKEIAKIDCQVMEE